VGTEEIPRQEQLPGRVVLVHKKAISGKQKVMLFEIISTFSCRCLLEIMQIAHRNHDYTMIALLPP